MLRVVFSYFGWDLSSYDVSLIVQIFLSWIQLRSVYCHLSVCPCFVLSNVESRFNRHDELSALGGGNKTVNCASTRVACITDSPHTRRMTHAGALDYIRRRRARRINRGKTGVGAK